MKSQLLFVPSQNACKIRIYERLFYKKQQLDKNSTLIGLGIKNIFLDFRDALEKIDFDAVVVVTPTKYHKEIVLAAANYGKPHPQANLSEMQMVRWLTYENVSP